MKKIYFLFFGTAIALNANAQLTLTKAANCPIPGTTEASTYFDSTSAVPKATGTNKNWDFSSMVPSASTGDTFTYVAAASTPSASSFPTATLATNDGSGYYNYYNSQTTFLDLVGAVDVSDGSKNTCSNPIRWMVWPFTFGTTNNDNFVATMQSTTLTINMTGNMNISGAGTGTVTLPGGAKYTNCLQIIRTYTYNIGAPFNGTVTSKTYEYWASSFKAPIISVDYNWFDDGSSVSPDISITVNASANVGIEEQELNQSSFVVYPNPVKEKLTINLKDNSTAEQLQLFDMNGKLVLSELYTNSLNTSNLNKGVYVLKVKANNAYSQKQIIISE